MQAAGPLDRREFLKAAAAAAACPLASCGRRPSRHGLYLTDEERQTAEALCDRIIPPDESPGAVEAGVVDFIDRQLAGHYADYQALYRLGLEGVDVSSQAMFGARLAELPVERQIDVLTALERDEAPGAAWRETRAGTFFELVVAHTMYGYYGDPRHGGNRDAASWRMVGLPHPPVRGRQRYELAAASSPQTSPRAEKG